MEALICDCCNSLYMTEKKDTLCEICTELHELKRDREFLLAYVDKQLEESRKFVMEYIGNVQESSTYHFHLGQATVLQDMKNMLYVQNM